MSPNASHYEEYVQYVTQEDAQWIEIESGNWVKKMISSSLKCIKKMNKSKAALTSKSCPLYEILTQFGVFLPNQYEIFTRKYTLTPKSSGITGGFRVFPYVAYSVNKIYMNMCISAWHSSSFILYNVPTKQGTKTGEIFLDILPTDKSGGFWDSSDTCRQMPGLQYLSQE